MSVPGESVGTIAGAGAANVIYGTGARLSATGNQLWTQDSPEVRDSPEAGDGFAATLTAGDFNGDQRDDLAVGVPREDVGTVIDAGVLNTIYGAGAGLASAGSQLFSQDSSGIADTSEDRDLFAGSLTSADFNGDGSADLAASARSEDVRMVANSGQVTAIYGSAQGLTATGSQLWSQYSSGIADDPEADDGFGTALNSADLNSDGRDDLSAGVSLEDVGTVTDAGVVNTIYGGLSGLASTGGQLWSQNSPGIADSAEAGDTLGAAIG